MPGLWGKRLVALIVDFLIITLLLYVIVAVIYPVIAVTKLFIVFNYIWIPIAAILIVAYFTYFEGKYRTTPGKNFMNLRVRPLKGNMTNKKAFIRNLSKILWIPLIIDILVGFTQGKPRERYLDRLAKTEVIRKDEVERPTKNLEHSTP